MERESLITARNLAIGYHLGRGKEKVINPSLDFELYAGQLTCLLGLNGAGKSTLIKTLCSTTKPLGGTLQVKGEIGIVLTERTNAGGLTLYELVSLGRYRHTDFFGRIAKEDDRIIRESLRAVGLEALSGCLLSEVSDGERQKAFIAKALSQECPVLMLDEPTAFLDVRSRHETIELLRTLAHSHNKAILLSTHDLELALAKADTLWIMSRGEKLSVGSPDLLRSNGTVSALFGI